MLKSFDKARCILVCITAVVMTNCNLSAQAPTRLPSLPVGPQSANSSMALKSVSSVELNRRLRWLFAGDYVVKVDSHGTTARLRVPKTQSTIQIRFPTSNTVQVLGSDAAAQQLVYLLRTMDLSNVANKRALVVRRRASIDSTQLLGTVQFTPGSIRAQPNRYIAQVQHTEPAGDQAIDLDPRLQQRLRDLGENVQGEVLPDLDVIILRLLVLLFSAFSASHWHHH